MDHLDLADRQWCEDRGAKEIADEDPGNQLERSHAGGRRMRPSEAMKARAAARTRAMGTSSSVTGLVATDR